MGPDRKVSVAVTAFCPTASSAGTGAAGTARPATIFLNVPPPISDFQFPIADFISAFHLPLLIRLFPADFRTA